MNFNSLSYLIFLPVCILVYYALPVRLRNPFLLAASYFFYMSWQPGYALLILTGTVVSYIGARMIYTRFLNRRRLWLALILVINLSILFVFKYYNFFVDMAGRIFGQFRLEFNSPVFDLLLPVGISFYVFQVIGYSIDVYRDKVKPETNFIDYALFVSFFPQLVAGPIERSTGLLPQFKIEQVFSTHRLYEGITLFVWGLFKKMVIADRLAVMVNTAFDAPVGTYGGLTLAVAAAAFSIQIYCDFSAYTDIARGSARMLGFDLMQNFDAPFLAASIKDFWRRWHISLSTWFKDYLYFPLGGSRHPKTSRRYINLLIVFVVSGLWHGAALSFLVWGMLHGLYQVVSIITKPWREKCLTVCRIRDTNRVLGFLRVLLNFALVTVAFVFFRAESVTKAAHILKTIVSRPWEGSILQLGVTAQHLAGALLAVGILFAADASRKVNWVKVISQRAPIRYGVYFALLAMILIFGCYGAGYNPQEFIYFQF